jgi:hypothetical protein
MEKIKNVIENFFLGSRKKENKGKDREENLEEIELEDGLDRNNNSDLKNTHPDFMPESQKE